MAEEKETKEDQLTPIEDEQLERRPKTEEGDSEEDDDDDEDDDEGTTEASGGDKRTGHAEGEEEGEDSRLTSRRHEQNRRRKERQRVGRERAQKELNFLRIRNEQLERRFSTVEARQRRTETLTVDQQLTVLNGQIEEAKTVEAAAIAAQEGEDAVEAGDIRRQLEARRDHLQDVKVRLSKQPSNESSEMPAHMPFAIDWVKRNPWYRPDGSNEDSFLTQAIETGLSRAGYNPATPEYWDKLDEKLAARGIGGKKPPKRRAAEEVEEFEEEDDPTPRRRKVEEPPPKRTGGGPRVSVGGQQRALRANEVYISPERKEAMIEAGVWDDPVLRQRQLKKYREWDREHGNDR